MKNLILSIVLTLFTSFIPASYAVSPANENQDLHVYFTNSTHDKLTFDRVVLGKPGSDYSVNPTTVNPGEDGVVTVKRSGNNDVEGRVIFLNANGDEASLHILVQRQVRMGQPIFNVSGDKYFSVLLSKTLNPVVGPQNLTYTEARLEVFNQPE